MLALSGDVDSALAALSDKHDPDSIKQRLRILIHDKRAEEAAQLVLAVPSDLHWIEYGLSALARTGREKDADLRLTWVESHNQELLTQRCRLVFASALYDVVCPPGVPHRIPTTFDDKATAILGHILRILDPLIALFLLRRHIDTLLEQQAVHLHAYAAYLLGHASIASSSAKLLELRTPLPIEVAQYALRGVLPPTPAHVARLRAEQSTSFVAQCLACLVEAELPGMQDVAFDNAVTLTTLAKSDSDREDLYQVLLDISASLATARRARADEVGLVLLGASHRLVRLRQLDERIRAKSTVGVVEQLDELRDANDTYWLQLRASLHFQEGDLAATHKLLSRVAELLPTVGLLRSLSVLSYQQGDNAGCRRWLELARCLAPMDDSLTHTLATLCAEAGDVRAAASYFGQLRLRHPTDIAYALNEAAAYVLAGDVATALSRYEALCAEPTAPLDAVVCYAQLLISENRPQDALGHLRTYRSTLWDDPDFVGLYMSVAYAAGVDRDGDSAFQRMRELHQAGILAPDAIQSKSLDDLVEHFKDNQRREEDRQASLAAAKTTWLLADRQQGTMTFLGWSLRTQEVDWFMEDAASTARFSIYATNSLGVVPANGARECIELECSPPSTQVVCDMSALVTLFRLGVLDDALAYFGHLHYPASYVALLIEDSARLVPHQMSEHTSLAAIGRSVDDRLFAIDDGARLTDHVLDEFSEAVEDRAIRVRDILDSLAVLGVLHDLQHRALLARPLVQGTGRTIAKGDRILASLTTLQLLHHLGLLASVARVYSVLISVADEDRVRHALREYRHIENCRAWTVGLRRKLAEDTRFVAESDAPQVAAGLDSVTTQRAKVPALLAAIEVANRLKCPLLADDRLLQATLCAEPHSSPHVSFGTDKLLDALYAAKKLSREVVADHYVSLMTWRYRFIVPPPEVLLELAERHALHPPGQSLRLVARYMHDCMRDPGLFSGVEPTNPPTMLSSRLYQMWVSRMAQFIAMLWNSGTLEDDRCRDVVSWVVTECLPSPPVTLGARGRVPAQFTSRMLFTSLALALCHVPIATANKAIRSVADALALDSDGYMVAVTEVVDELS